jgi:carbon monoxide dehydrogenase subunit G
MARYVDAIDLDLPLEEAFDYLADFSTTAEWDPGVVEAERLTPGPIGRGTRFRVVVAFLGRTLTFEYEIIAYEPPHRLVLRGTNEALVSTDEIGFMPKGSGTRVTYEARLELTGLLRLADPVLHVMFQHVGRLAVRGLRERTARGSERVEANGVSRRAADGGA